MRARAFFAQALDLVGFVFLVVAIKEHPLAIALGGEDVGTDAVEEPAVVADDHDAAGKFEQRVFQRAQGFHVQVVRGFVQQQHVAALHQGFGQVQATAFTAREHADFLLLVRAVEIEAPAVGAAGHLEFAHGDDVQPARNVFPHGFIVGQVFAALIHKGHLHGFADADFAAVGLLFACDKPEQCGFARTVGADDAHNRARRHFEAEVVDQQAVAKGFADVFELDDFAAQTLGHRNEDLLGFVALLVFVIAQFFKARQTRLALGLTAFGILARPFQLFFHGLGAGIFRFLLLRQAGFFLL